MDIKKVVPDWSLFLKESMLSTGSAIDSNKEPIAKLDYSPLLSAVLKTAKFSVVQQQQHIQQQQQQQQQQFVNENIDENKKKLYQARKLLEEKK